MVVEPGRGLGLPPEALHEGGVARLVGDEHLDRHLAVEELVVAQVDLGHAALGQVADDAVAAAEDLLGHRFTWGRGVTGGRTWWRSDGSVRSGGRRVRSIADQTVREKG